MLSTHVPPRRFFYKGLPRFSYGWDNPNHAAAVLLCVLPCAWAAGEWARERKAPGWGFVSWGGELLLSLGVAFTLSRGAAIAWAAALVFYAIVRLRVVAASRAVMRFMALRAVVLCVCLGATGLGDRVMATSTDDRSAMNRLSLWRGGLELIYHQPLTGWGKGASGIAYMQWMQDPQSELMHGGMVNSYLHLACEFGLPALFVALLMLLVGISAGNFAASDAPPVRSLFVPAASAGLFGFSITSIFSTLWPLPSVIATPAALLAAKLYILRMSSWTMLLRGGAASAAAVLAIFAAGRTFAAAREWRLQVQLGGAIESWHRLAEHEMTTHTFWLDRVALGPVFGRTLRGALGEQRAIKRCRVVPPGAQAEAPTGAVYLCGARWIDFRPIEAGGVVCLVSPVGPTPGEDLPWVRQVLLPGVDEMGFAGEWRNWAEKHGKQIVVLPMRGSYIGADILVAGVGEARYAGK